MDYLQHCWTKAVPTRENEPQGNSVLTQNTFLMKQDTKGVVYLCSDPLKLEKGKYGQGNNGIALALYKLPDASPVIMWH